jgi:hypothetical protein
LQEYRTAGSKKEDQSSGVLQELNNKELCCRQEKERDRAMNYKQWDNDVEEWEKLMLLDKHRKVGL